MFNWISPFNYDYAIATIPIQVILLMFYGFRRNLPTRQSLYFWIVMVANLSMTLADIISCEMNEIWTSFPLWIMYAINHAYFLAFLTRGWALFAYTYESSKVSAEKNNIFVILSNLPVLIGYILILSTPWTSAIYTISADGYHNCSLYGFIYFSTYFYIIVSIFLVLKNWECLKPRIRNGLFAYNLLLLLGILIRKQFYHMLITSYFSILSILIIFLTAENPDLYRDNRTTLLNKVALDRIGREFWENKIPFSLITISIHNYDISKMVYGIEKMNEELLKISHWIKRLYPNDFVFYVKNGIFIVLSKGNNIKDSELVVNHWKEQYKCLNDNIDTNISSHLSMMLIPASFISKNIPYSTNLARYGIQVSRNENNNDNFVFTEQMVDAAKKKKDIEKAIRRGIEMNSFEVYFQPIYSVQDKKILGAEALARLNDPELGFISPSDFIPISEKNGDILDIGKIVFEKVCIFLEETEYKKLGIEFINVNLSPIQCIHPNLVQTLSEIAEKHNVPMSIFDFEITEAMIEDYEAIQVTIAGLRAIGAELSLDDFGTGAANLASLMKLPIHVVKIDMSFVWSYFKGKANFLPDLIKLFLHSKMEIVVEGIEDKTMMDAMAALGCNYEQGYYFSKPLPPEKFVNYMENIDTNTY